jgi:hypothetical protein
MIFLKASRTGNNCGHLLSVTAEGELVSNLTEVDGDCLLIQVVLINDVYLCCKRVACEENMERESVECELVTEVIRRIEGRG